MMLTISGSINPINLKVEFSVNNKEELDYLLTLVDITKCKNEIEFTVKESANGTKEYYKNNILHRDDDLPAVEYANGHKEYWEHDKFIK